MFMQRLCTSRDANGNPRHLWLVYSETGEVAMVIDEGYTGKPKLDYVELPNITVFPAEYTSWKRFGKERGILIEQS